MRILVTPKAVLRLVLWSALAAGVAGIGLGAHDADTRQPISAHGSTGEVTQLSLRQPLAACGG